MKNYKEDKFYSKIVVVQKHTSVVPEVDYDMTKHKEIAKMLND